MTAAVLCGGAGLRLGGVEKPLREFLGRPLIERVLERLRPQVRAVTIVANREQARYRTFATNVVDDGAFADCGPLAGILAALASAPGTDVLIVPGDAPLLPTDLLTRLESARGDRLIAHVDDGGGPQPLCALIATALHRDLHDCLAAGERSPCAWMARHSPAVAHCGDWPRWGWSVNTPAEWTAAESAAALAAA